MYGPDLRTYCLGAVVSVLLGTGIGLGWHYIADSAGGGRRRDDDPSDPAGCAPALSLERSCSGRGSSSRMAPVSRLVPLPATSRTQWRTSDAGQSGRGHYSASNSENGFAEGLAL